MGSVAGLKATLARKAYLLVGGAQDSVNNPDGREEVRWRESVDVSSLSVLTDDNTAQATHGIPP